MKFTVTLFILITLYINGQGQKVSIDTNSYKGWQSLESAIISPNGQYIGYLQNNIPTGSATYMLKNVESNWEKRIPAPSGITGCFSKDSHYFIFSCDENTIQIIQLASQSVENLVKISSFKFDKEDGAEWIAYQTKALDGVLVLRNLITEEIRRYEGVDHYQFDDGGKKLVIRSKLIHNDVKSDLITIIDLNTFNASSFDTGVQITQLAIDNIFNQISFISEIDSSNEKYCLWYFRFGMKCPLSIAADNNKLKGFNVANSEISFTSEGKCILFTEKSSKIQNSVVGGAHVWNYLDPKLKSAQMIDFASSTQYQTLVSYNIDRKTTNVIKSFDEDIISTINGNSSRFVLIREKKGDQSEWFWNSQSHSANYLVSLKDGLRYLLPDSANLGRFELSPNNKYVVFFGAVDKNYHVINVATGNFSNITKKIKTNWTAELEYPKDKSMPSFMLYWTKNDSLVMIRDSRDIWLVDPEGKNKPICLTNKIGQQHNIEFRPLYNTNILDFKSSDTLYLEAFDKTNKFNGFYSFSFGSIPNLHKLTMGPYIYTRGNGELSFPPIKAKDVNKYLVRRMSSFESPNFFITDYFETFTPITSVTPQANFNWLTSEHHRWKVPPNIICEGILYKPENFDSTKKYPIIFYFYETLSDELNVFKSPLSNGYGINIPFLVSNGYLVFEPDIHYKIGHPGRSAYKYVMSAVDHMTKYLWVDRSKMGVAGHSFGGFEVDYIISHTKIFAAAMSASGMSDFVSAYNCIIGDGTSRQRQYEYYRDRIGTTLWSGLPLYLENSPVLFADKINTPLLMMNNSQDADVPFSQGGELFVSLRRLHKRVWMLQYDNEGHQLVQRENMEDFNFRQFQFFNSYLKDKRPPIWMARGIPINSKGLSTGFAHDDENFKP